MEKRNIIALAMIGIIVFVSLWYLVGATDIFLNPFVDYLHIKIEPVISCEPLVGCHYHKTFSLDYRLIKKQLIIFNPRKLSYYCQPFVMGDPVFRTTLTIQNPDLSKTTIQKSVNACNEDAIFYFNIPLDKGAGVYKIKAKVCGATLLAYECAEREITYYYSG